VILCGNLTSREVDLSLPCHVCVKILFFEPMLWKRGWISITVCKPYLWCRIERKP